MSYSRIGKHRWLLIILGLVIVVGASLPPFLSASCVTRQQNPAEIRALENLRAMTRGGALPTEDAVARIETDYPRTRTAGLARLLRARIHLNTKDFAGASALLDANVIRDYTTLGDYALFMRGDALEQAGRRVEARATFEKLARDYPSSLRGTEALVRNANLLLQAGEASAVPVVLKDAIAKDDPSALLLSAKSQEQQNQSALAVAAYRRLYFYAPASAESANAPAALTRLGSSIVPANAEELSAPADRLYQTQTNAEASAAYAD